MDVENCDLLACSQVYVYSSFKSYKNILNV